MNEKITVEIFYHSNQALWEYFSLRNLSFSNWKELDAHHFLVDVSYDTYKKIKKELKPKVIKKEGIFTRFIFLVGNFSTLFSFLISLCFFFMLFTRVHHVSIDGENHYLNQYIEKVLNDEGIKKGCKIPSSNELLQIEKKVKKEINQLEFLEIRKKGVVIHATYRKERKEVIIPQKGDSLFATKSGIISYFRLTSGVTKVVADQYVEEGTLLVDAYVDKKDGTREYVGAYGSVYAHTWSLIQIRMNDVNDVEVWNRAWIQARYLIAKNFDGDEQIEKEEIIREEKNGDETIYTVHYTCLEDICKKRS